MIKYPKSKELINIFLSGLNENFSSIEKSEVLRFTFNGSKYVAYFKCVSYAGTPYPLNTTRAQLPQREEFNRIESDEKFLFIGYDVDNDVFVCWDPIKAKSRLNKKSYVSFFCRQNIQDSVTAGNVVEAHLTNGDVYVLFKKCDIPRFFEMIEIHFPDLQKDESNNDESDEDVSNSEVEGRLGNVCDDEMVKAFVDEMLVAKKSHLTIVSECSNAFGAAYPGMLFKEWNDIVKKYYSSKDV
jgi:hypothetical protein